MSISHMWSSSPRACCICVRSSSVSIYSVHPLFFLNPACSSKSRFWLSRCRLSLLVISLSTAFNQVFVSDIGLLLLGLLSPAFFGISHMSARLSCVGTYFVSHMCYTNATVISTAMVLPFFSSSADIPSGPGALLFLIKVCIIRRVACGLLA